LAIEGSAPDRSSDREGGFFLAIEAGRVDHALRGGNLHRVMVDGVAFNDAIRKAI